MRREPGLLASIPAEYPTGHVAQVEFPTREPELCAFRRVQQMVFPDRAERAAPAAVAVDFVARVVDWFEQRVE